jgi:hypothetical protein
MGSFRPNLSVGYWVTYYDVPRRGIAFLSFDVDNYLFHYHTLVWRSDTTKQQCALLVPYYDYKLCLMTSTARGNLAPDSQ